MKYLKQFIKTFDSFAPRNNRLVYYKADVEASMDDLRESADDDELEGYATEKKAKKDVIKAARDATKEVKRETKDMIRDNDYKIKDQKAILAKTLTEPGRRATKVQKEKYDADLLKLQEEQSKARKEITRLEAENSTLEQEEKAALAEIARLKKTSLARATAVFKARDNSKETVIDDAELIAKQKDSKLSNEQQKKYDDLLARYTVGGPLDEVWHKAALDYKDGTELRGSTFSEQELEDIAKFMVVGNRGNDKFERQLGDLWGSIDQQDGENNEDTSFTTDFGMHASDFPKAIGMHLELGKKSDDFCNRAKELAADVMGNGELDWSSPATGMLLGMIAGTRDMSESDSEAMLKRIAKYKKIFESLPVDTIKGLDGPKAFAFIEALEEREDKSINLTWQPLEDRYNILWAEMTNNDDVKKFLGPAKAIMDSATTPALKKEKSAALSAALEKAASEHKQSWFDWIKDDSKHSKLAGHRELYKSYGLKSNPYDDAIEAVVADKDQSTVELIGRCYSVDALIENGGLISPKLAEKASAKREAHNKQVAHVEAYNAKYASFSRYKAFLERKGLKPVEMPDGVAALESSDPAEVKTKSEAQAAALKTAVTAANMKELDEATKRWRPSSGGGGGGYGGGAGRRAAAQRDASQLKGETVTAGAGVKVVKDNIADKPDGYDDKAKKTKDMPSIAQKYVKEHKVDAGTWRELHITGANGQKSSVVVNASIHDPANKNLLWYPEEKKKD